MKFEIILVIGRKRGTIISYNYSKECPLEYVWDDLIKDEVY